MADNHPGGRGPPPRDPERPQYGGEEEERMSSRHHLPPPSGGQPPSMTLPSIQDATPHYGAGGRGYGPPPDPRSAGGFSASPINANGYATPQGQPPQLPAFPYPSDQRYGDPYSQPGRGGPHYPPQDAYASYAGGGYRPSPPGQPYSPYAQEYARVGVHAQPPPQQAAPRQRTSIACRYCRKRKIRCSGYQNTTNGKCTNCDKLRIDCVFQPVSSNSSTAFIPVSAVPGGVPPGTPLYGAYGQPLPPAGTAAAPAPYGPSPGDFQPSMPSPAGHSQFLAQPDDRSDASRRRPRAPEDDPGLRLPPPNPYNPDDDPRRRSPASGQPSATPPTAYHQYAQPPGSYETDRTPTPRSNSSGNAPPPPPPPSSTPGNIMSLGNLVDHQPPGHGSGHDIDQSMLGKLNRRT